MGGRAGGELSGIGHALCFFSQETGDPPFLAPGMTPLATLPMYDWPEIATAQTAFWGAIRDGLRARRIAAPEALSQGTGWREPGLVFSQTCGWPWASTYRDALDLVATPVSALPGCDGDTYSSMVIVRADAPFDTLADLRGARVAFNGMESQSGVHTLREAVAPLGDGAPFFGQGILSGAHRESIRAVARGAADCAAIDAICWAMAQRFEPVDDLRVIHCTAPAPALPFVTRRGGPVAALRAALEDAIAGGYGEPVFVHALAEPDAARYDALIARVVDAPPLF